MTEPQKLSAMLLLNTSEPSTYEESIRELGFNVYSWAIQVVVLFVLFIFGFIGNITVFILLLRRKLAISSTIRHLILNLVMADLFVVNFCILTLAIWHYTVEWLAGDFVCRLSKFMQMFSLYASTFIIVVISIDRCMAVVAPISRLKVDKYGRRNSHKMVVGAWMLAGLFSVPQAIIFKVQQAPTEIVFYQCVTFGSYTETWQEPLYTSFTLCVNFLFPFVIIITCYTLILHRLSTSQRSQTGNGGLQADHQHSHQQLFSQLSAPDDHRKQSVPCYSYVMEKSPFPSAHHHQWNYNISQRSAKLRKARATSLCLSVLIVLTFVICWGPYYVRMVGSFIWEAATDENVDNVVFFFGMSNSVINPLIYATPRLFRLCSSSGPSAPTLVTPPPPRPRRLLSL
ncbi:gonadotropin-releasing hormone receptor-like isoform X2 [Paramacrobiotus metropolitanus]|uniref:gonadotropin-releasing hormone receptor-like isoform X2 n=1 Tax=Paramacrobiotus metropolitanus TaxID=2943436 RepID=UPI0024456202|nr:gonadotropin-releasing hormone receptor-like isoform X2 [Paramacrobiotus metropolitanus]